MTTSCSNLVKLFPESIVGLYAARPVINAVFGESPPSGKATAKQSQRGGDSGSLAVRVDAAEPPVAIVQEVSGVLPGVAIALFFRASDGRSGHRCFAAGVERPGYEAAIADAAFAELDGTELASGSVFRGPQPPPTCIRSVAEKHLRAGYGFIYEEIRLGYQEDWKDAYEMDAHFKNFDFLKSLLNEADQQYCAALAEVSKQRTSRLSIRAKAARQSDDVLQQMRLPECETVLDADDREILRGLEQLVAKIQPDFRRELAFDVESAAAMMVARAGN